MAQCDPPLNSHGESAIKYFQHCDEGNKSYLDSMDFYRLTRSIFDSDPDFPAEEQAGSVLSRFNLDANCRITEHEFEKIWNLYLRPLFHPVAALLVIDVQNDFLDGSLAMRNCPAQQEGKDVVLVINGLIQQVTFDVVAYSMDYHPKNHISFFTNVNKYNLSDEDKQNVSNLKVFDSVVFVEHGRRTEQKLWPVHCVQGTWGADLYPDLRIVDNPVIIHKGTNPEVDSYSAFWDNAKLSSTGLHDELRKKNVTHVFVTGLALDYCVAFTALDASELGYATVVVQDATRGTDDIVIKQMLEKMRAKSCVLASSDEVRNIRSGKDIRLDFVRTFETAKEHNGK